MIGGFAMTVGEALHSGGMAGLEPTFTRQVPSSLFADVPRFHTGTYLKQGEVPAILKDDEAVFTQGQLGAIGRMNHSYDMVEGAIGSMARSMSMNTAVPSALAPAASYDPTSKVQGAAGKSGTAPPMTVNMNNQTGSQMGATASQPRFDGEQWVVDIVLKHANRPGPLRNTLQARQSQ